MGEEEGEVAEEGQRRKEMERRSEGELRGEAERSREVESRGSRVGRVLLAVKTCSHGRRR